MIVIKRTLRTLTLGLLGFFLLSAVGGILLKVTPFPESWGFGYLVFCLAVICFPAGIYMSSVLGKGGLLSGAAVSCALVVVVFLITSVGLTGTVDFKSLLRLPYLIPLLTGAFGGIMGVNVKK